MPGQSIPHVGAADTLAHPAPVEFRSPPWHQSELCVDRASGRGPMGVDGTARREKQPLPNAPLRRQRRREPSRSRVRRQPTTYPEAPSSASSGPALGRKVLQLCRCADNRKVSIFNFFKAIGMGCSNYDTANGPQCDLSDSITFAQAEREVSGGEFVACTASPECGTFSKLHNLPGPPPLRAVSGPERYGFKHNSPADKERVKLHNLISVRVAKILGMFID